jgi:putative isomerase
MRGLGLCLASLVCVGVVPNSIALAQSTASHVAPGADAAGPRSQQYEEVQRRLARGWNTWDVHSVATQVLLPEGLAIRVGLKNNATSYGDEFLGDVLIGRLSPGAEVVTPGPHAWDGSYTELTVEWKGHKWRLQTAHDGEDLVMLVTPLPSKQPAGLPPTVVFSVNFLWNRPGTAAIDGRVIQTRGGWGLIPIYCTCDSEREAQRISLPVGEPYFAADLTGPTAISTRKRRSLKEVNEIIQREFISYVASNSSKGQLDPIRDAIETTLGWDTIYEPEKQRVISPVSRVWSMNWGGYVLFDWDTFFAATLASIGDKDLAYANALETLREETKQGFVPNFARAGNWKSSDRSEPPVGAITVLGLYRKFQDGWFLEDAFEPLLSWNRWWNEHRQMQGYIVLGSDGDNEPVNLLDTSHGTWQGAIYESGLDNSPMYDGTLYNPQTHLVEYADVGMTSMYIADCDALAEIADAVNKTAEAKELRDRAERYRAKLATLWDEKAGIFLNKDLHTGQFNTRLSPTNFYPLLAKAATAEQAQTMISRHLLNRDEFWGEYVMPSIERDDPAFKDQNYWRGRVWGPMNYLVYLGIKNYPYPRARKEFAEKSYELFVKEWREKGHVHENYTAITGSGDDVESSDRFYHWGALLGYVEYLEQAPGAPGK